MKALRRIALIDLVVIIGFGGVVVATACATLRGDGVVMSGAFAACAKTDLGQIVKIEETKEITLLGDVAQLVEGNGAQLEADLTTLAGIVGVDAVECAIAAIQAVLAPTPTGELPPGLARALAWETTQAAKARK